METEILHENENQDSSDADSHWDDRILCSDGNCIGVIGADGRCKECGKPYEGPLPESLADDDAEDRIADENQATPAEAIENNALENPPGDEDWESRVLCSDGNCIGVIGPDGKCKVCGKPYE